MARLSFPDLLHACAVFCLTALIALCIAWELWLAPLRPGGSWMVLKALPLLAPLFGILHRRLYTFRWSAMLAIAYFVEGAVRVYADSGLSAVLAGMEIVLALLFFAAAVAFVRASPGPSRGERVSSPAR
ncbi:MAG: DUF2069 domain-containing protein [Burkholderiales bacterium]